jgi:acetyltransferase-like isoleucine patch superfamily enzyme
MQTNGRSRGLKLLAACVAMFLPGVLARPILNSMGHRLRPGSRVGLSWLYCDFIGLDVRARVGHFNVVAVQRLLLRKEAQIGWLNYLSGPLDVRLRAKAEIGSANRVSRAPRGVTTGVSSFYLGELTKITLKHHIDCTRSVHMGAYSTLAGTGTQVWTHGYVHDPDGPGRYRIDGRVDIGRNVYIGSACLVSMGVRLVPGVIVGGGTTVSRSLLDPGLYVSGPLRILPRPADPATRAGLMPIDDPSLCETVYLKRTS